MIKENRETKVLLIVLGVIFLIIGSVSLFKYFNLNRIHYSFYNESSDLDYKVYLKGNEYYNEKYLGKDKRYIASLIDYIDANFKYNLKFEEDFNFKYSYKIVANTKVIDKYVKDVIYNEDQTLYESEIYNGKERIDISQNIKIDYNKYNDLVREFIEVYDLDETNCVLEVKMYLNFIGTDNNRYEDVNRESVMSLSIPLTTKTVAIDMSSDVTSNQSNKLVIKDESNYNYLLITGIFWLTVSFIMFGSTIIYTVKTMSAQEIYDARKKKILSNYGSDIQIVTNDYKIGAVQVIKVGSFDDMLEIKDTTKSPLLMIENKKKTGAFFIIQTNIDVIYTYALRVVDIEAKKEGVETPDYDLRNINKEINEKKKKYTKEYIDKQLTETIALKAIDKDNAILGNKDKEADIYEQLEETREYRLDELNPKKKTSKKVSNKKKKQK